MANDDWYKDPPGGKPPSQQPGFEGGFSDNTNLPPEGQGWESLDPDPVLDRPVQDANWGTAPPQPTEPHMAPTYGAPPDASNQPLVRQPQQQMTSSTKVEVEDLIPVVLSIFLPGAGHIMLGQTKKGILLLAGIVLCGISYILSVVVALDAYMVGQARKHRHVDEMEFFPK